MNFWILHIKYSNMKFEFEKTVGVKFCGGCHPTYDRASLLEQVKKTMKDFSFEYVLQDKEYIGIIVLCNCRVRCADLLDLKSKTEPFIIDRELLYEEISAELKKRFIKI